MPDSSPPLPRDAPRPHGRLERFSTDLREALQHHGLLLALSAAVMVFGNMVSVITGYVVPLSLSNFIERYIIFAGLVVLVAAASWTFLTYALVERRPSPHRAFGGWLLREVFSGARWLNGCIAMAGVLMLVMGFLQAKNNALRLAGYVLDVQFSALDRALHLGWLPQDLLRPLLGGALATRVLDIAYVAWQPAMLSAFFLAAFQRARSPARHRFLLSMTLVFGLGGSLMAVLLASGGPAFYGLLTGLPDPYATHMQMLEKVGETYPLNALSTQRLLWSSREISHGVSLITAMPSMHVAVAALIAMAAWSHGWQARMAGLAFFALIFLGSIHLGWHYAADGYAGILIAWASWKLALPLTRWYLAPPAPRST